MKTANGRATSLKVGKPSTERVIVNISKKDAAAIAKRASARGLTPSQYLVAMHKFDIERAARAKAPDVDRTPECERAMRLNDAGQELLEWMNSDELKDMAKDLELKEPESEIG